MKTFNIELSADDIEAIGSAIDELKYKIAAPLARKIQAQIDAQLLETPAEPAEPGSGKRTRPRKS